jgi:hypothetical protein
MSDKNKERLFLAGILVFAVFMYWEAGNIGLGRSRANILPSFWPRMVLAVMIAGSAGLLLLDGLRAIRTGRESAPESDKPEAEPDGTGGDILLHPRRGLYSILYLIVYIAAIPVTGFVIPSVICTAVYLRALGQSPISSLATAAALTAMITLGFAIGLGVPLPHGLGPFADFSRLLY